MQLWQRILVLLALQGAMVSMVQAIGGIFLSEKPDVLRSCRLKDPEFGECWADNLQVIFQDWKNGLPGLAAEDTLDPFFVKRVIIPQDPNSPVTLDIDLHNIMVSGISRGSVSNASFDRPNMLAKFHLLVPKLDINSEYNVKGRILNIFLNGNGKAFITIENSEILVTSRFSLRTEGGFAFLDVEKMHLELQNVNGLRIRLDNLFHGQSVLEESANAVFNDHWHDFYELLQPPIKGTLESFMHERLDRVFGHVPASFFIADIEGADGNP